MGERMTIESSRIAVVGQVDSGKSTTIGVLKTNKLDDGRGLVRVTTVKHEADSGRTSTVGHHYLINETPYVKNDNYYTIAKIGTVPKEVTTILDLCGHQKYFKTTMYGVYGSFIDFGIVLIGANAGITDNGMTIEHITLFLAHKIPFIILVTKIDMTPANILEVTVKQINRYIGKFFQRKLEYYTTEQSPNLSDNLLNNLSNFKYENKVVPVIFISNVTGLNLPFLKQFLFNMRSKQFLTNLNSKNIIQNPIDQTNQINQSTLFSLDNCYTVKGTGLVVSGFTKRGKIINGSKLFLGPVDGKFMEVVVRSIHNCIREPINELKTGESGGLALRLVNHRKDIYEKKNFKKGQVIISDESDIDKYLCHGFIGTITIGRHSTNIKSGYQAMIQCNSLRESIKLIIPESESIKKNDDVDAVAGSSDAITKPTENNSLRVASTTIVHIYFIHGIRYLEPDEYMLREGLTKGWGTVTELIKKPYVNPSNMSDPRNIIVSETNVVSKRGIQKERRNQRRLQQNNGASSSSN